MGLDISFRRISCLLVVGLILLTVSALANASAALSYPYTQVTEVAKSPVVWDPTRGAGVQTITKTCSAANACAVKPVTQWIPRSAAGLGRFVRIVTNPYVTAAMLGAGWLFDDYWQKQASEYCAHFSVYTYCSYSPESAAKLAALARETHFQNLYPSNNFKMNSFVFVESSGSTFTYRAIYGINSNPKFDESLFIASPSGDYAIEPADEIDVWDALSSHSNQSDSWQVATEAGNALLPWGDLFPNASPAAQPDPLPEVSPSDAALLDLLKQGLLQSTDPYAPHYVSPAELARLQALAQQMEDALNQKAEEALQAMKQPITQQQYDESNARDRAEFANALPDPNFLPDVEENLNSEIDIINDTPELPTGPDLTNLWSFSTGTCNGFTLPASVAGRSYSITVDKQCDYYPEFNAALNFMLYLLTAFQIFNIYHRAMLRG